LTDRFIAQLTDIRALVARHQTLEEGVRDTAELAARSLGVARCSVMLIMQEEDGQSSTLRVYSHYGDLPAAAYAERVSLQSGIAGQVASSGEALLINDLRASRFANLARQGEEADEHLMSAPIQIAGRVIGVINVSKPTDGRSFSEQDLDLLKVFSMVLAQSIHVFQLQKLSESRLLQMAQVLEKRDDGSGPISPEPERLAHIVAKGFYRELAQAGFGPKAIISVATEVLGLLHENLEKHRARLER